MPRYSEEQDLMWIKISSGNHSDEIFLYSSCRVCGSSVQSSFLDWFNISYLYYLDRVT